MTPLIITKPAGECIVVTFVDALTPILSGVRELPRDQPVHLRHKQG